MREMAVGFDQRVSWSTDPEKSRVCGEEVAMKADFPSCRLLGCRGRDICGNGGGY